MRYRVTCHGRGGIRTHGTLLTYTHFPGVYQETKARCFGKHMDGPLPDRAPSGVRGSDTSSRRALAVGVAPRNTKRIYAAEFARKNTEGAYTARTRVASEGIL